MGFFNFNYGVFLTMSNRAIRRAAERAAKKAAKQEQKNQAATATTEEQQTMAAAAGASSSPSVDFANADGETATPPRRPVSDAQRAANKANAQKSHGAVTPEGRLKSSLNAVKTGLTGQTVLLPTDDAIAYQAHLDRHFMLYAPATDQEQTLVQMIADAEYRLLRIPSLEASIYAIGRIKLADLHPDEADPVVRETLIRGEVLLAYRRDLSNLALQERRIRNQHKSDLEKLEALQKERIERAKKNDRGEIQARIFNAIKTMMYCEERNLKFIPSQFGFEFSIPELEYCADSIKQAYETKEPTPWAADLLAQFRSDISDPNPEE